MIAMKKRKGSVSVEYALVFGTSISCAGIACAEVLKTMRAAVRRTSQESQEIR